MSENASLSVVALERCPVYDEIAVREAVTRALEPLGGMARFVRPGDRVLIKPNMVAPGRPGSGICTHPLVLRAVCALAAACRPSRIRVGDLPGYNYLGEAGRCREDSGLEAALEGLPAEFVSFEGTHVRVSSPRFRTYETIDLTREVLDADVVISLPKLKTHRQTHYTGAVKNFFGCVTYETRARIHKLGDYTRFCEGLVDIFEHVAPRLTVADLVRVQEGNGPCAGTPVDVGVVLAGEDAVAVDAVGQFLLGFGPHEVLTTNLAAARGLGRDRLESIRVAGPADWREARIAARRPDRFFHFAYFRLPRPVFRVLAAAVRVEPRWDRAVCQVCGTCADRCPGRALAVRRGRLRRERRACRLCFGCVEACPRRAVRPGWDRASAREKARSERFLG